MPRFRLGILAGLLFSMGCGWAQQGAFERTLNVSGPVRLDVMTDAGGIIVTPGPAGTVRVKATLKRENSWLGGGSGDVESRIRSLERNPPVSQSGSTILIGHVSDRALLRGVSMRLEITTPSDSQLRARADSGGIHVEGIRGPVDAQTDSGGITADNIGSEIRAQADSGGIRLRGVQGNVFARADSGGVVAQEVAGSVDVSTDSGGIRISQTKPAPIKARADSGGATIRLVAGAGYDIDAESEGGLTVTAMSSQTVLKRGEARGKIRGGGPMVDVRTDSGHVTVE